MVTREEFEEILNTEVRDQVHTVGTPPLVVGKEGAVQFLMAIADQIGDYDLALEMWRDKTIEDWKA